MPVTNCARVVLQREWFSGYSHDEVADIPPKEEYVLCGSNLERFRDVIKDFSAKLTSREEYYEKAPDAEAVKSAVEWKKKDEEIQSIFDGWKEKREKIPSIEIYLHYSKHENGITVDSREVGGLLGGWEIG